MSQQLVFTVIESANREDFNGVGVAGMSMRAEGLSPNVERLTLYLLKSGVSRAKVCRILHELKIDLQLQKVAAAAILENAVLSGASIGESV